MRKKLIELARRMMRHVDLGKDRKVSNSDPSLNDIGKDSLNYGLNVRNL